MADKRLIDEKPVLNQIGTSGAGLGANRTKKQNALSAFEADIAGGTGVPGAARKSFGTALARGDRTFPDVTDIAGQKETIQKATARMKGFAGAEARGVGTTKSSIDLVRPKHIDMVDAITPSPLDAKGQKVGGTKRQEGLISFSVTDKKTKGGKGGHVTDTGTFRRKEGGPTLREEANAPGLFKSVRETIAANFKANRASAVARGARADAKAVNAKRKSLGDLFENISATDPTSPLLEGIKAELQKTFTPDANQNDEAAKILAISPNMDRGTLKQILAIRRGN